MGNISHKAGCADGAGMIFPIHFGISVEFLVFLYVGAEVRLLFMAVPPKGGMGVALKGLDWAGGCTNGCRKITQTGKGWRGGDF